MQPDGPTIQIPPLDPVAPAAMGAAAQGGRKVLLEVLSRGDFLVRTSLAAISCLVSRARVQTRVAVGQIVVFRSVRNVLTHPSKIASCVRIIATRTDARFESAGLGWNSVLTAAVGLPHRLEVDPAVALPVGQPGRVTYAATFVWPELRIPRSSSLSFAKESASSISKVGFTSSM
jgi:hypothetical protein